MKIIVKRRGYSLYELIMTLALFAITVTLGIPSFGAIVANHRLRVEVDQLFHAIHHARKESIVRRRVVSICPTADGEVCGEDWSAGWMMFVNINRDWPARRQADEPVIKWLNVAPENRITANRRSFSLRSVNLRATNGTLVFATAPGAPARERWSSVTRAGPGSPTRTAVAEPTHARIKLNRRAKIDRLSGVSVRLSDT